MIRSMLAMLLLLGALAHAAEGAFILDYKMNDIDGNEVELSRYKGKVLLVVNVASKCGLTPQYAQLVEIHKTYAERGFQILGFPANNFMGQEPGSNEDIKTFCVKEYDVAFDMFAKISVKGKNIAPLYAELTSATDNGDHGGAIPWNFTKFLINREGRVVARFGPRTKPDSDEVIAAIERELAR